MKFLTLILLCFLSGCVKTVTDNDTRLISKLVNRRFNTFYHFGETNEWVAIDSIETSKLNNHLKHMHQFELEEHQTIDSLSDSKQLIQIKIALHSFISDYYRLFYLEFGLIQSVFPLNCIINKQKSGNRDSLLLVSVRQLNEYDSLVINLKKYANDFNVASNRLGLKDSIKYDLPAEINRRYIITSYFWNISQKTKDCLLSQE